MTRQWPLARGLSCFRTALQWANAPADWLEPAACRFSSLCGDTCFLAHIQSSSSTPTGLPCLSVNFFEVESEPRQGQLDQEEPTNLIWCPGCWRYIGCDAMDSVNSDGSDPCTHPHAMKKSPAGKLAMGRESRAPA